jgi:hypothetical protein
MERDKDLEGRPVVDPASTVDEIPPDSPPPPEEPAGSGTFPPISSMRERVATVVAVVALGLLAWFYAFMVTHVEGIGDLEWTRRREILTGVEAIVFAAAGFLFGSQVQRQAQGARVDAAKEKAADARRQARREELKAERERTSAESSRQRSARAEREAGELAAAFLTAQEAAEARGAGDISLERVHTKGFTKTKSDEQAGRHPIDGLTTLRALAENVLARDRDRK